jgi:AraC-like DNA-binding protein
MGTDHKAARSIVIQWQDDILGKKWIETNEFISIQKLITHASRGIKFDRNVVEIVEPMLNTMMFQTPFEKLITFLQILSILAKAKDIQLLSGDNFTAKLNNKSNARINVIHNFVRENYHRKITLKEVSKLVSMSEEPFCRFFKKTFNKSFFTFLNEYKIKLACKLLIESDQHVTEIAFRSGYESLPFFYRQFNKFIGCSPLAYQQKCAIAFA